MVGNPHSRVLDISVLQFPYMKNLSKKSLAGPFMYFSLARDLITVSSITLCTSHSHLRSVVVVVVEGDV